MRTLIILALALLVAADPFDGNFPECTGIPDPASGWQTSCHVFGHSHIFTFDGASYHPHMIGDYVLVHDFTGNSVDLQARYEWCPGHKDHVACITGFAFKYGGETVAFYYDEASDRLASTYGSYLVDFRSFSVGSYDVAVMRRVPDLGYHISIYNAGGFQVMARFSQSGNSISFIAPGGYLNDLAGLCGTLTECPYDDIVNMWTGEGVGWEVAVNTWQVWDQMSLFEQPKFSLIEGSDLPPFVLHAPMVPYRWDPIPAPTAEELAKQEECDLFMAGNVWDACAYEEAMFGNHDAFMVGMYEPCAMFCGNPMSPPITGFTDEKFNCSTFCDYQMDAAEKLPDWIWSYPEFEGPLMGLQVSETHYDSEVFMMAPLGGQYKFQVVPDDCCHDAVDFNKTVTVDVNCANTVAVHAVPSFSIDLDEFWLPEIMVFANLGEQGQVENNIHVMWTIVDPDGNYVPVTDIMNVFSLMPVFTPTKAGVYQLTVVATDGCSLNYNKVNVTINCLDVVWQFASDNSDSIQWHRYGAGFSYLNVNLERSCLTPVPFSNVMFTNDLSYLTVSPLTLRHPDPATFILGWVHNQSIGIEWQKSESADITSPITTTGAYVSGTPFHSPAPGFEDYYRYWTNRLEWEYDWVNTTTTSTYWTNYTRIYQYAQSNECYLTYTETTSANSAVFQWHATPAPDAEVFTPANPIYANYMYLDAQIVPIIEANRYFTIGECEGTYQTKVDAADPFACTTGSDTFKFDVTCTRSPRAHTLTPCFDIPFDYNNHQWYSFTVYGDDAEELWRRELDGQLQPGQNYMWFYDDVYQNAWNDLQPLWTSPLGYTLVPGEFEGTHSIIFRMNDGCNRDEDTLSFRLICNYTISPDMTTAQGDQNFDYIWHGWVSWTYDITGSQATTWVDPYWINYDANIRAYVSCTGIVAPWYNYPAGQFVVSIDTSNFETYNTLQTVVFDCVAHITDYCDIQDRNFQLKVKCTYVITVALAANPSASYTFDAVAHTFPAIPFDDASTEDDGTGATNLYFHNSRYYVFHDGVFLQVYNLWNYNFNYQSPGQYNVIHEVTDGCMRRNNTGSLFTLACASNVPVARIVAVPNTPTVLVENLPAVINLYSNQSSLDTSEVGPDWSRWSYWTLEADETSPGVYSTILCDHVNAYTTGDCWFMGYRFIDFLGFANSDGWVQLHLPVADPIKYRVTLYITDGCKPFATSTYVINTACQLSTTARITVPSSVQYQDGKFDKVCLNGGTSSVPYSAAITWRNTDYRYEIVSAPAGSLYAPNDVTYLTTTYTDFNVWDVPLPYAVPPMILDPSGYLLSSHVTGNVTKDTHYVTRTYLKNLHVDPVGTPLTQTKYGACFRPDLPGTYRVVLHMWPAGISCYYDASDPVDIIASCNAPPVITSVTGTAAGIVGERAAWTVVASDADEINYLWTLVDEWGNDYTPYLTNRHAKDVSAILYDVANYTLSVTVVDGCSMTSRTFPFTINCPGTQLELPKIDNEVFRYDGLGSMAMTLDVEPLKSGAMQHYTWYLVDFSPIGWDNASFANYPAVALLLLALIVVWF